MYIYTCVHIISSRIAALNCFSLSRVAGPCAPADNGRMLLQAVKSTKIWAPLYASPVHMSLFR